MGAGRTQGDPRRLRLGDRRAGLLSRCRGDRRHRHDRDAAGGSARRQRCQRGGGVHKTCATTSSRISPTGPTDERFPVTPQRIVHDVRQVMPGGRHRLPRQRHVQDLVRAQLPDHRRQHAAARQRAGDDGRRPALGDDGRNALSGTRVLGGLRRRRLHDEQPGDGDRGPPQAQPRRADPRGLGLRHDPLEAGGRPLRRFRHDLRQSGFRALRRVLRRARPPHRGDVRIDPDAGGRLQAAAACTSSPCRSTTARTCACWSTSSATGVSDRLSD